MTEVQWDVRTRTVVERGDVFVGPWIGEFGHELMFVGAARAQAVGGRRVIACSRPGSAALYADFAAEFVPHAIECEGMCAGATAATAPPARLLERYVPPRAERFGGCEYRVGMAATWHKYGRRRNEYADAVVIHARSRPHVPMRNWSQRNWNTLARRMVREGVAKRIICVGLRRHALTVEGALDMRDAPLAKQMDVLASARWAVGPSSGPLHLASHCGCPHLAWCGGGPAERNCTHRRYLSEWNPLDTPVHAHRYASWQPTVETVWGWVTDFDRFLRR